MCRSDAATVALSALIFHPHNHWAYTGYSSLFHALAGERGMESAAPDSLTRTRYIVHHSTTHKYRCHWKDCASGNNRAWDCWRTTLNKTPAHLLPYPPTISSVLWPQLLCHTEWLFLSSVVSESSITCWSLIICMRDSMRTGISNRSQFVTGSTL